MTSLHIFRPFVTNTHSFSDAEFFDCESAIVVRGHKSASAPHDFGPFRRLRNNFATPAQFLNLKFLHELAARLIGTSNSPRQVSSIAVPQDDVGGSSKIARDKVGRRRELAVAAANAGPNENGAQAGAPRQLDVPGLIADHP